jgi:phage recombination protein Bet
MNQIATIDAAPRRSITQTMAHRFGMEPDTFLATLTATVFSKGMSREEQAAFLIVADQYHLNPVTREIYSMPKKGGGIIPVVSIDGWVRMCNEHRQFDGMEFEDHHDGDVLISTTCRIFRKDRTHPIAVTEYFSECYRDTDAWKMKHRMLRHKSLIQCARYAFGFAGIYDQDEAERFAATETERHPAPQRRAPTPSSAAPMIEHLPDVAAEQEPARQVEQRAPQQRRAPAPTSSVPQSKPEPVKAAQVPAYDPEDVRERFTAKAKEAPDLWALNAAYDEIVQIHEDVMLPPDKEDLIKIYEIRRGEIEGD